MPRLLALDCFVGESGQTPISIDPLANVIPSDLAQQPPVSPLAEFATTRLADVPHITPCPRKQANPRNRSRDVAERCKAVHMSEERYEQPLRPGTYPRTVWERGLPILG